MRPVRLLALAAALIATASAFAQEDFPDVPANHWAYEALARMKHDGLLVGYPDGLYRGGRPASRYELAVAMHAVYTNLKNVTDGLDAQIKALGAPQNQGDIQALKDAVAALQADVAAMKGYAEDIADIRRASDTFELELTQLGVDVQAMKDDLKTLAGRVQTLEAKPDPIRVSGTLDLWAGGGHGDGAHYGLDRDGRLNGIADKGPQDLPFVKAKAGVMEDLTLLHEAAIDFATTNPKGVRFNGTLVASNAFGRFSPGGFKGVAFGNQSTPVTAESFLGVYGYSEGSGDIYLQTLAFSFSGRGGEIRAGRIQHRASPWIFRRLDNTLYFDNPRWDSGDYTFDGLLASTHAGPIRLEAYGGNDHVRTVDGFGIDPLFTGVLNGRFSHGIVPYRRLVDHFLGGSAQTSIQSVHLRGDYLVLDADKRFINEVEPFDQLQVFGGEGDYNTGRFRLSGGLRQSEAHLGADRVDKLGGNAWDAKLGWASGRLDLGIQYRAVQTNYLAPGDWGRLGILRNPTNLGGFIGKARVDLTPRCALSFEGETSHGLEDAGANGTRFDRNTNIGRFETRFDVRLGHDWDAYARYEQTDFSHLVEEPRFADARYQWYGVGVSHGLAANASFSLSYEQSAIHHDYQSLGFYPVDYRGGFLTSQVTVKF